MNFYPRRLVGDPGLWLALLMVPGFALAEGRAKEDPKKDERELDPAVRSARSHRRVQATSHGPAAAAPVFACDRNSPALLRSDRRPWA